MERATGNSLVGQHGIVRSAEERHRTADASMRAAEEVAAEVVSLLSFPKAAARVLELLGDSNSSNRELAAVLATDPGLSARVLRVANSCYYGAGAVTSVEQALSAVGRAQLLDLTIGVAAVHAFDRLPNDLVAMEDFWSHSFYCGIVAELMARRASLAQAQSAFTAGLLHDIGQLVLFTQRPVQARRALMITAESGEEISMAEAETHLLGFDHAAVGLALARSWKLPDVLLECVGFHHAPVLATRYPELVATVHVANALSIRVEANAQTSDDIVVDRAALDRIGGIPENFHSVAAEARERFAEVRAMLR